MNKLDFSQVVDPGKRQPVPRRSWEFLQSAIKGIFEGTAQAFIGDSYSASVGYVMYEGRKTGAVIADGFVFYNGEWYYLNGADTTAYVNVPVVIANNTDGAEDPITFTDNTTGNVHNQRNLQIADQVSGTGLFDYSAAVFLQDQIVRSNVKMATKVIDIGDWNMDSATNLNVNHGLTAANIRRVSVTIRNDAGTVFTPLDYNTAAPSNEGSFGWAASQVAMTRTVSGFYDNTGYDQTSYNRGWITIDYVV